MKKPNRIFLNGDHWRFKPFLGQDWVGRRAQEPGTRDLYGWNQGSVPGSVHADLWQRRLIPDPYVEKNSLLIEWVPERTWLYKRSFFADPAWQGRRLLLCFEGVDYSAHFFLNGESIGRHEGMFLPARFEIGERLKFGEENLLAVVIEPAPDEQPQVGQTSLVRTHKSRMNYWWDFCPRMIHVGIWDDVYLEITGSARIEDLFVRPQIDQDFRNARLRVMAALDSDCDQRIELDARVTFDGREAATFRSIYKVKPGRTELGFEIELEQPHLWWPNGEGEQALYELELRIGSEAASTPAFSAAPIQGESDAAITDFGVRQVEFIPNETPDQSARPYTLQVNGKKIYIKGWNWVPIDVLYGVERPEKLERLLSLAQRAHVNMLRVWGGGLIEKEAFYHLCDQLGILVWQEFIQSSSGFDNAPAEDPDFIAMMTDQARRIIPRRRNHTSLAIWCGGNELQAEGNHPLDDTHPVLAALHQAVKELDPDRHWLPTSPTGPVFANSLEEIKRNPNSLHDVHGPWEFQGLEGHYTLCNQGTALLHSEFGVEGITNKRTLDRVILPEHQQPVSLDNPVWFHLGAWWLKESMWRTVFGHLSDMDQWVRCVQYLQAAGLGYAVEANRLRAFHNSGSLPWQFNEPYPMAACTSAVDYYARPKPAYYAVARAYRPVRVCARFPSQAWHGREVFEAGAWVSNSTPDAPDRVILELHLRGADGQTYAARKEQVSFQANGSTHLLDWQWELAALKEDIFFLDVRLLELDEEILDTNRYAFSRTENLAPMLDLPITNVVMQVQEKGDTWSVTLLNTGQTTALFVWLEDVCPLEPSGYAYFADNHFCLFPGESRNILVEWIHVPLTERKIQLSGWNFNGLRIPE